MSDTYRPSHRELQERFDTVRLADRLAESMTDRIDDSHRRFIEARDMFFIASTDADGNPQCSYKGGDPGFVRVLDETTIAFPVYDGNGMFLTTGNLLEHPQVGLLFIDWETGSRLRVNGTSSIDAHDQLLEGFSGALFVVQVRAAAVFANCRRYVHTHQAQERSVFVPAADEDPPVPDWKLDPWFEGTLAADDPAHDPEHPTAPAIPLF